MAVDPDQKSLAAVVSPELPQWLEQYRWPIVGGVAAVALVVGVFFWTRSGAERANADAFQRLATFQTANDLMAVTSEYPDSKAAPIALMKLAKAQYDEGSYEEAMKSYTTFAAQYPQHTLAEGAELGRLHCLEAMGRTEDALKGFETFVKTPHYLAAEAVIAQARCLRTLGKSDDARVVYEDFITANPKSAWSPRIKELLEEVTAKPAEKSPASAAVSSTAPATADATATTAPASAPVATAAPAAVTPVPAGKP